MTTGRLRRSFGAGSLIITVLMAGCGGGDSAKLRIMNASPGETGLDVLVDGKSLANGVAYAATTDYLRVDAGSRHLQMEPAGSSTVVVDQTLDIGSAANMTLIANNFAANISAIALADDNTAPTSGNAKLRVVQVAPSLGTVDVFVVLPGTNLLTVPPTVASLSFQSASTYQSLAAGTYQVFFTTPGSAFVIFDAGTLTINAGQNRTFAVLNAQAGGFTSVTLKDLN